MNAGGEGIGRLTYESASNGDPRIADNRRHVYLNIGDHLGSSSVVIDKATSELVERRTYLAYGATESDYRPVRWKGFREDYGFTGKEEDVEVGLQYFGKRYLSPYLGRWVSADPLAVHVPGDADLNLYAYVSGAVLSATDPLGLEGMARIHAMNDSIKDRRLGPLFFGNWKEFKLSLSSEIAKGPVRSGCNSLPSLCRAVARGHQGFQEWRNGEGNHWQTRLLGEYLRGGDSNRTHKLSLADSREWVERGHVTPLGSKKFTEFVDGLASNRKGMAARVSLGSSSTRIQIIASTDRIASPRVGTWTSP